MSQEDMLIDGTSTIFSRPNVDGPVLTYVEHMLSELNVQFLTAQQTHRILDHSAIPNQSPRAIAGGAVYLAGQLTEEYLTQTEIAETTTITPTQVGSASAYLLGFDTDRKFRENATNRTIMEKYLHSFATTNGFPEPLTEFAYRLIDKYEVLDYRWHQPRIVAAATLYTAGRYMGLTLPNTNGYYSQSNTNTIPYHLSTNDVSNVMCDGKPCARTLEERCDSFSNQVDTAEAHRDCAKIIYGALYHDGFNAGIPQPRKPLSDAFRHISELPREEVVDVPGGILAVNLYSQWIHDTTQIRDAIRTGALPVDSKTIQRAVDATPSLPSVQLSV